MKVLLCVLLGVLPAFAFPTPEAGVLPECIDPTFACQDLQSAKLCKVVSACIHDVWETMSVPDSNDEVCDICKEMVKEARDQLLSNMTQEEIKEVFEGSCKLLPIKFIADACMKVVDEIIPQLVEMLASRMDPTMVCTVSGMCFPSKDNMEVEKHILTFVRDHLLRQKNDDQCAECTQMMTDVQTFMKSSTEAEVKEYIKKLCDEKMPSYLCNIVLNSYFNDIYNYVLNTSPKDMCDSVGICPKECKFRQEVPKVEDELTCEFCEHLVKHVIDLITANTTLDEFKTAMLNFCNKTGKWADKCTNIVNEYYDTIFNYINKIDPKGVCTLMGLCGKTSCSELPHVRVVPDREAHRRIPLINLQPARPIHVKAQPLVRLIPADMISKKQLKDSNDVFQLPLERITPPLPIFQKDTECALCKAFSFYLEKDLAGDKSKAGVRRAMNGVCEKWMVEYPEHCKSLVNAYSRKMEMAIAKGISFDSLCSEVKACPLEENKKGELNVRIIPKSGESPFCDLCKDAMNQVEKILTDPATKKKLEESVDQLCNVLPSSLRDDCVTFVKQNVDAILDILQQELQGDQICPALKLCGSQKKIGVPSRVKDLECDVCKDVVTSFRTKLQDPASKTIVLTFLEEGCRRLPGSAAAECKKFVDENIDTVLKLIVEEMDPQKVCSILNICPASIRVEPPKRINNDPECELCKEVVGKVEDLVKDKKTEAEIEGALDKVCSYLPSSMATKCKNFVDKYTATIVTLLMQELDPKLVCVELGLCPASVLLESPKAVTNNVECELCKQVISKVEDLLKEQKTEEMMLTFLEEGCMRLPESVAGECKKFVDDNLKYILRGLVRGMDPQTICSMLNVCPAPSRVEPPKRINDVECDLCKEVISKVEDMVKDKKTEDEIKAALDKVCSYLPSSMASKCKNFVDKYTDTIVTLLLQELDPDMVCGELGLCPASVLLESPKAVTSDVECELCKQVIGKVEDLVKDGKTEDAIKSALEKVCSFLPSSLAPKCQSFVDQYTATIVTLLMEELDPQLVCAELKLCPAQIKEERPKELQDLECDLCKEVVQKIKDIVEDKKTEDEIREALDKVCSYLPSSIATKCENFVNRYTDYLIAFISQDMSTDLVCAAMEICPEVPGLLQWKSKVADVECEGCQYALHFVQNVLMSNETEGKVKELIKHWCSLLLPQTLAGNCAAFIDEYGDSLLVLIAQEIDPSGMCFKAGMCKNNATIPQLMTNVAAPDLGHFLLDECSVCTTVVDYMDKLLEEDDVDKEITHLVEKVCAVVPASFRDKCSSILEAYGPYILQMIGQVANSKQLCQDVDLCPRTAGHVHLIGGAKCTFGPSYWCHSAAHAAACKAESYCQSKVWVN